MVVLGVLVTFFGAVFLPVNCVQDTPSLVVSAVGVDDSGRFVLSQLAASSFFPTSGQTGCTNTTSGQDRKPTASCHQLDGSDWVFSALRTQRWGRPGSVAIGRNRMDIRLILTGLGMPLCTTLA